ncbi:hypothetical protein TNCV_839011 [Trichonephila clavipes]|nr:hypothetical protein TNCV_839011 [Trichonephila clavipes]
MDLQIKLSTLSSSSQTNRKYFGRFPKRRARSGLSGYPESLRQCLILGLTFNQLLNDIPSPPHSPHPLVSLAIDPTFGSE